MPSAHSPDAPLEILLGAKLISMRMKTVKGDGAVGSDPKAHIWFVRHHDHYEPAIWTPRTLKERHSLTLSDAMQIALAWVDEVTRYN